MHLAHSRKVDTGARGLQLWGLEPQQLLKLLKRDGGGLFSDLYYIESQWENVGREVEAAYTLLLYDELLEWSDRPLREFLTYPMQTEWQRKEHLHLTIIQNFDRGKHSCSDFWVEVSECCRMVPLISSICPQCWENGIILCRKIAEQYESYYDYRNLSKMRPFKREYHKPVTAHKIPYIPTRNLFNWKELTLSFWHSISCQQFIDTSPEMKKKEKKLSAISIELVSEKKRLGTSGVLELQSIETHAVSHHVKTLPPPPCKECYTVRNPLVALRDTPHGVVCGHKADSTEKGPPLLNKEFVCRGHDYERLEAFQQRMLNEFPHAIAMQHANQPDETIFQAEAQYLQIYAVTPIPESQEVLQREGVPDNIKSFYKVNHIWKFRYDRPFHKGTKDKENEFKYSQNPGRSSSSRAVGAPTEPGNHSSQEPSGCNMWPQLQSPVVQSRESSSGRQPPPGWDRTQLSMLPFQLTAPRCQPQPCNLTASLATSIIAIVEDLQEQGQVVDRNDHTGVEMSPLENAIEVLENKNQQLKTLISQCQTRQMQNINPLTMCLNGVIDAAVNGGVSRYQEAFFVKEYILSHPEDGEKIARLRELMLEQAQILEFGLAVHEKFVPQDMRPLHKKLVDQFFVMKSSLGIQEFSACMQASPIHFPNGSPRVCRNSAPASVSPDGTRVIPRRSPLSYPAVNRYSSSSLSSQASAEVSNITGQSESSDEVFNMQSTYTAAKECAANRSEVTAYS
ncbi:Dedicator of cytokinesis protein 4 [Saguinus oedipus]|uniref:Dedicator of cytokinesis protein 4 n=1 Tax=Saguinus oedipus TaxID=9490 RepID=A0ABQ9UI25_SAGOE|nr:Dedicator of cytokinesis protein 4 [Saguinus oedipus]